jgi:SAM-dependent methyltransferase
VYSHRGGTLSGPLAGLDLEGFPRQNGVWRLSAAGLFDEQQSRYLEVREREGRLLDDEIVTGLPVVPPGHRQVGEWRVRAWSMARLQSYLTARPQLQVILDVGCGNGWLAARLAEPPRRLVYALDVNEHELEQGARVFRDNPRLIFLFADVTGDDIPAGRMDLVLLAGAVQYFPFVPALVPRLLRLLRPGGELHIIDSPFYGRGEEERARARSEDYYRRLGCPEMAGHYHHHCFVQLEPFGPQLLHDPSRIVSRVRRRIPGSGESPFPWIRIRA